MWCDTDVCDNGEDGHKHARTNARECCPRELCQEPEPTLACLANERSSHRDNGQLIPVMFMIPPTYEDNKHNQRQ